jgi:hypothetical protein
LPVRAARRSALMAARSCGAWEARRGAHRVRAATAGRKRQAQTEQARRPSRAAALPACAARVAARCCRGGADARRSKARDCTVPALLRPARLRGRLGAVHGQLGHLRSCGVACVRHRARKRAATKCPPVRYVYRLASKPPPLLLGCRAWPRLRGMSCRAR